MAIVKWAKVKHEESFFNKTLCNKDIPTKGKEWWLFGETDCKRCRDILIKQSS